MTPAEPILEAQALCVSFNSRGGLLVPKARVRAVNGVDLAVCTGETLGLVGESGSGKSTTGRALLRLVPIDSGTVRLRGNDITSIPQRQMRGLRRHAQMVFQDPYSSLDPSMTVGESIGEPLSQHLDMRRGKREAGVRELLDMVRLPSSVAQRYPYEFSGGQRQRIAIARAIAARPSVVICDEAVSALDVSTQNQIINLLEELRAELGLSLVFIAHDLAVVEYISNRVAVMYLGRIVELGDSADIFGSPAHPYTKALLSAVPRPAPSQVEAARARRIILQGEVPDPSAPPTGCAFHPRCPDAMPICAEQAPPLIQIGPTRSAACHLHLTSLPDQEPATINAKAAP